MDCGTSARPGDGDEALLRLGGGFSPREGLHHALVQRLGVGGLGEAHAALGESQEGLGDRVSRGVALQQAVEGVWPRPCTRRVPSGPRRRSRARCRRAGGGGWRTRSGAAARSRSRRCRCAGPRGPRRTRARRRHAPRPARGKPPRPPGSRRRASGAWRRRSGSGARPSLRLHHRHAGGQGGCRAALGLELDDGELAGRSERVVSLVVDSARTRAPRGLRCWRRRSIAASGPGSRSCRSAAVSTERSTSNRSRRWVEPRLRAADRAQLSADVLELLAERGVRGTGTERQDAARLPADAVSATTPGGSRGYGLRG